MLFTPNPDAAILKDLFNSFKPDSPLEAGDPRYVDFQEVRGDEDILTELGGYILKEEDNTYQLYSGHRGSGKSTELKRLAAYLEQQGCVVVYFAAATEDAGDLSFQDTQYQDILLSCTRQLLEKLQGDVDYAPIWNWLEARWETLKELALTDVSLNQINIQVAIPLLSKITAAVRTEPNKRDEIRKLVEANTESLVKALNEFIGNAKQQLEAGHNRIVIIADNLDRIAQIQEPDKMTNLEEIFINRSELMRSLNCHMVYTAPISLLYSRSASNLQDIYGKPQILPMVMVQNRDGDAMAEGIQRLRLAMERRVMEQVEGLALVPNVFETDEVVALLCLSCGGHLRDLMHIIRNAINRTSQLPIKMKQVKRAIADFRPAYLDAVMEHEWELLFQVHQNKTKLNDLDGLYRDLLGRRCILEYRFFDEVEEDVVRWYDVHPLIRGSKPFRERWALFSKSDSGS